MSEHRQDGWQGFDVNVPNFIRELREGPHRNPMAALCLELVWARTRGVKLCHCALSGDVHVVRDGQFCEAHQDSSAEPFTPENVEKALKYLAERPTRDVKIEDVARAFYEGCSEQTRIECQDLDDQPPWDSGGENSAKGRRVFIAGAKKAMALLGRKE